MRGARRACKEKILGAESTSFWAAQAWLPGGWRKNVLLQVGNDGCWSSITPDVTQPGATATVLDGPLLPGLVDAHSHAFQRAFAGLAETRETAADDFWSWRDSMYRIALRITPEQMRAIAAHLFVELLRGGYTHVCEFHYLQHDQDGQPYATPLELSWALAQAAAEAGIGLTMLPVIYERAGFAQPMLRADQRRFAFSADQVREASDAINSAGSPLLDAGLGVHSLRAARPESIRSLQRQAAGFDGPIHCHVAEQLAEVDECVAATGARPIEWLAREGLLDARWHLVHATHTVASEITAVGQAGAGVVLCPSTEGNLGDGLADLRGWLAADVSLSIGSDSHVTRAWREELRWLDYGQRLMLRQRNVSADPQGGQPSTAARLFERAVAGGGAAAGQRSWGLQVGARADALLVDRHDSSLLGIPLASLLDTLVFSSPGRPWRGVMVAGRWVVDSHQHARSAAIAARFEAAMKVLQAER